MSKPVKKVRLGNQDSHPPTRRWLIFQERLNLWKSLNGLNGTSTGSETLDASLRAQFGGYSGDPMARQFHARTGPVVAADAPPVEIDVPNVEPTEQVDLSTYGHDAPKWI